MNRMNTIAALALSGAVALTPMLALADTSVDANAGANVETKSDHSFFGLHFGGSANAGRDENRNSDEGQDQNGDHKLQKESDKTDKMMQKGMERGTSALDARIETLQDLQTRINAMTILTADQKTAISAQITAQITALTNLKANISSDVSTSTLIADLKSMHPDFHSYLLTLPRTAIIAASDRVMAITGQMDVIGAKLQSRIAAAQAAGANVSAAQTAYADYQAKVADAKVQAKAASDLVINLDTSSTATTTVAANNTALKAARAKLEAARADLKAARKDMMTIMQTVKGKGENEHLKGEASTTVETH